MQICINYVFLITLFYLGRQDFSTKLINSLWLIPSLVLAFLIHPKTCLFVLFGYLCAILLNHISHENWIGYGDLDVLACGLCVAPNLMWFTWLNAACCVQFALQILYYRQHQAPFVPSLAIGWTLTASLI